MEQRDQTVSDLNRVGSERDELAAAYEQLHADYENTVTTRGAALVMRNAAILPPAEQRRAHWLAVGIPVITLLVVTLAVALILGSH